MLNQWTLTSASLRAVLENVHSYSEMVPDVQGLQILHQGNSSCCGAGCTVSEHPHCPLRGLKRLLSPYLQVLQCYWKHHFSWRHHSIDCHIFNLLQNHRSAITSSGHVQILIIVVWGICLSPRRQLQAFAYQQCLSTSLFVKQLLKSWEGKDNLWLKAEHLLMKLWCSCGGCQMFPQLALQVYW